MGWLTEPNRGGDFVVSEYNAAYTREEVEVDVDALNLTTDLVLPAGYPLDGNELEVAAGIAGCDGLLLQPVTLTTDMVSIKLAVLRRGPAVINMDQLPLVDKAGATINRTTWATALAALGIVVRYESDFQEEQTT